MIEEKTLDEQDRGSVIKEGFELTYGDRARQYGPVTPNMQGIARFWQAHLESVCLAKTGVQMPFELTGEDVAHMMILLKMQRAANMPFIIHRDNYADMVAYSGIAAECAYEERCDEKPLDPTL